MQIKTISINELTPYENNARINDNAVNAVANSIKEFGFKVPIIIDRNNVIIAGHTRVKAAKACGMKEVPCICADDLSDEQARAFRLADNKLAELSMWDYDKLYQELEKIPDIDMSKFELTIDEQSIKKPEAKTYTNVLGGVFKTDDKARKELMALLR